MSELRHSREKIKLLRREFDGENSEEPIEILSRGKKSFPFNSANKVNNTDTRRRSAALQNNRPSTAILKVNSNRASTCGKEFDKKTEKQGSNWKLNLVRTN
jgi:hypothetical protein